MTTKAVIYARFSPRPNANESLSNTKQIERCREYAAQKGYEVNDHNIFTDEALTGIDDELDPDPVKSTLKRPGLQAAIAATKKGMVLLVRWRNRIARDQYIQGWARRCVMKKGGRIESTDECNEQGMAGEMLENTLAVVDKYRAIQIRLDTALAMMRHQRNGRRMTRIDRCPFGWTVDPEHPTQLTKEPEELETIKIIRRKVADGMKIGAICRHLDDIGRDRRGKTWKTGRSTVLAILRRHNMD